MYYREAIVDGVLCCKHTPNGEWIQLSAKQLTKRIERLKVDLARTENQLDIAKNRVHQPI